ncbi:MAG: hypothetical protein JW782_00560 [Candidatus Saganbacteria bacterium]|nr:hypothetical protein [Candidatus Saganbacteria bacterium]
MLKRLILIVGSLLCLVWPVSGRGLDVGPAVFRWQDVVPGKVVARPFVLRVTNRSDLPQNYTVHVRQPGQINSRPDKGFEPLPETSWLSLATRDIRVPPRTTQQVPVFLKVPAKSVNYGKAWQAYIEVREKTNRRGGLALACYPKVLIKTIKK